MARHETAANAINLADRASPRRSAGVFARLSRAIADFRKYRCLHDELSALTDRELFDLDLSRLNLRDIAREAAYGR